MERGPVAEDKDESSVLIPLSQVERRRNGIPVTFDRRELDQILRLYGTMVAANEWRDYAIDHLSDRAVFSVFRRTSEVPLFRIVKDPALARRQGAYAVVAATGMILKRGHELARVLSVFDKTLKLVKAYTVQAEARNARSGNDSESGGSVVPPLTASCMKTVSSQRPCL